MSRASAQNGMTTTLPLLADSAKFFCSSVMNLLRFVSAIRLMVRNIEAIDMNRVSFLEEKLERCRTQENNPRSEL
jgi:hypothetical protein